MEDQDAGNPLERIDEGVVLACFGASWCTPWKLLDEALESLRDQGVDVRRIDTDQLPHVAEQYRVASLPTFVALVDGVERARKLGAVDFYDLTQLVDSVTAKPGRRRR